MRLDNLKFRALENGFTIKYHVTRMIAPDELPNAQASGFGGELYVKDVEQLKACVLMLIDKHTDAPA